ncbi:MAG TPA: hypothetical protein VF160_08125 [Candidatus Dormibacteraeota bacterium]
MTYAQAAQAWHDFYVTAGAAAATLVGLLFVGLSLHIRVVVAHPDVRGLARVTLTDFVDVLLVSLMVLAPVPAVSITYALFSAFVVSFAITLRVGFDGFRRRRLRTIGLRVFVARFGLSVLCYLGLGAVAALFARGDYQDGLGALLGVVLVLLAIAVRNTWDLLVTVADKRAA